MSVGRTVGHVARREEHSTERRTSVSRPSNVHGVRERGFVCGEVASAEAGSGAECVAPWASGGARQSKRRGGLVGGVRCYKQLGCCITYIACLAMGRLVRSCARDRKPKVCQLDEWLDGRAERRGDWSGLTRYCKQFSPSAERSSRDGL